MVQKRINLVGIPIVFHHNTGHISVSNQSAQVSCQKRSMRQYILSKLPRTKATRIHRARSLVNWWRQIHNILQARGDSMLNATVPDWSLKLKTSITHPHPLQLIIHRFTLKLIGLKFRRPFSLKFQLSLIYIIP